MSKGAVHALWATRRGTAVSCPSPGCHRHPPGGASRERDEAGSRGDRPGGLRAQNQTPAAHAPCPSTALGALPGPARPGLACPPPSRRAAEPQAALLFSRKAEARRGCDGAPLAGGIHSVKFLQFLGEALSSVCALQPSLSFPGARGRSSHQVPQLPALAWVSPNTTPEARPTCSGVFGSDPRGRSQLKPLPRILDPARSFEEPHEDRTVLEGDSCPPSFNRASWALMFSYFWGVCARKTTEYFPGGFTQRR